MHNPNNLRVLERAFDLVVSLHRASLRDTARVASRAPGLCGQLLHAATAISSNIVEGAGQSTSVQFARFLLLAIRSATETEQQLELAIALELFGDYGPRYVDEVREIRRMLHGLRKRVLEDGAKARSTT